MIDRQTDEDTGQHSRQDANEVAEVEVAVVAVHVSGETILNACPNKPSKRQETFMINAKYDKQQ